ncbi:MAG: hypothetical protein ACNS61_16235 [Candidatus Wenzhouxiangella sp. M2_3B_020]
MKNLLLIAAFALMASPAFAQSSATTNQTGSGNDAEVIQTGGATATVNQGQSGMAADNNEALVSQSGANETLINQFGSTNDAQVMQGVRPDGTDAGTASGNYAKVEQTGSNNSGLLDGADDDGSVVAQGVNGTATDAQAYLTQSGENGRAQVYQGNNGGTATNVTGTINQDGDDNMASVRQGVQNGVAGDAVIGSTAQIDQLGTASTSTAQIRQGADGSASSSISDEAFITQQGGSLNQAFIDQGADDESSELSLADISQDGSGNTSSIAQYGGAENNGATTIIGHNNTTSVTQVGNSNRGVYRSAAEIIINGDGNDYTALQTGDGNRADMSSNSDGNTATITQSGNSNQGRIYTYGGGNDNNTMSLTQGPAMGETVADNRASFLVQNGSTGNMVTMTQEGESNLLHGRILAGADNTITIEQRGDDNFIGTGVLGDTRGFEIQGDNNTMTITQLSDGNDASAFVNGAGNTSTITQN